MVKSSTAVKILFIVVIVFVFSPMVYAEWKESIDYSAGKLYFDFEGTGGNFLKIPDSTYIFFFKGEKAMIFDINSMKIRSYKTMPHSFSQSSIAVIPDPVTGWNLFYPYRESTNSVKFGKIHIDKGGQIGEEIWFPRTAAKSTLPIGIPEKSEVWFFTEKILRLNAIDESWAEFDYPQDWDFNWETVTLYPVLHCDTIIETSYGKTKQDYQAFILDTISGEARLITAESGFFNKIIDISNWNKHPNQYLILKSNEIFYYNSTTGDIGSLIKDFGVSAKSIMQDENGRYFYAINNGKVFYKIDLIDKTVISHDLSFKEYDYSGKNVYDAKRSKIIAQIQEKDADEPNYYNYGFVIIDPGNFSVKYVGSRYNNLFNSWLFLEEVNKIFFISIPYFISIDFGSEESKNSIPILYNSYSWNIIDDINEPILLNNSWGSDFIRILPDYGREKHTAETPADFVCQFPDTKKAIVGEDPVFSSSTEYYMFKEYNFVDGSSSELRLDYAPDYFITDEENGQIIGIGKDYYIEKVHGVIQFLKSDGSSLKWYTPEETHIDIATFLFEEKKSLLWLYCEDNSTVDLYFYKLSTKTKSLLDSFKLQNGTLEDLSNIVCDPEGKYLYFIDETNSGTMRELVICDPNSQLMTKRITLQENVKNGGVDRIVIPGIIPVPEKNKLFIWDHWDGWCIDTNSMEILYGKTVNNPDISLLRKGEITNPDIKGKYLKDKNCVLVVDINTRVIEVDLDTGNIMEEYTCPWHFSSVHFTEDNEKIIFLNNDDSVIYTLHLNPPWDNPASITPSTNYIQLGSGDNAKFSVNVKNPYDFEQRATAYIWMYAPDGTMLFFGPTGLTMDVAGIPLTLPANCDVTGDILSFTMPPGVPEGFYNFNAVFINENGDRGPIGTWNFYVKD